MTTIRLARPEEYERVGRLTVDVYRALPVDHLWGGYEDHILDTASRAETTDVLVAVVDENVVGAVTFVGDRDSPWNEWTQPGEAQFRLLVVDPAVRGRGIGEALVRECLARAGGRPIIIHTTRWMEAAQRMYERLGFQRRPDRDVFEEEWLPLDDDVADVWKGEAFLAYSWSG